MPCMPCRREMHTGRYNFLHRSWGPLEPFDDSMPQTLHQNGVHSHKVTDHHHYWVRRPKHPPLAAEVPPPLIDVSGRVLRRTAALPTTKDFAPTSLCAGRKATGGKVTLRNCAT